MGNRYQSKFGRSEQVVRQWELLKMLCVGWRTVDELLHDLTRTMEMDRELNRRTLYRDIMALSAVFPIAEEECVDNVVHADKGPNGERRTWSYHRKRWMIDPTTMPRKLRRLVEKGYGVEADH